MWASNRIDASRNEERIRRIYSHPLCPSRTHLLVMRRATRLLVRMHLPYAYMSFAVNLVLPYFNFVSPLRSMHVSKQSHSTLALDFLLSYSPLTRHAVDLYYSPGKDVPEVRCPAEPVGDLLPSCALLLRHLHQCAFIIATARTRQNEGEYADMS
jgi:hypothetical protein